MGVVFKRKSILDEVGLSSPPPRYHPYFKPVTWPHFKVGQRVVVGKYQHTGKIRAYAQGTGVQDDLYIIVLDQPTEKGYKGEAFVSFHDLAVQE